jgi:hypothetical protein
VTGLSLGRRAGVCVCVQLAGLNAGQRWAHSEAADKAVGVPQRRDLVEREVCEFAVEKESSSQRLHSHSYLFFSVRGGVSPGSSRQHKVPRTQNRVSGD